MDRIQLRADAERLPESLEQLSEPIADAALAAVSGLSSTGTAYFYGRLAKRLD